MTNTLVERLQGSVCYASTNKEWPNNLLTEAVNEIERLRKEGQMLTDSAHIWREDAKKVAVLNAELLCALQTMVDTWANLEVPGLGQPHTPATKADDLARTAIAKATSI
jgi:hypothetical protein